MCKLKSVKTDLNLSDWSLNRIHISLIKATVVDSKLPFSVFWATSKMHDHLDLYESFVVVLRELTSLPFSLSFFFFYQFVNEEEAPADFPLWQFLTHRDGNPRFPRSNTLFLSPHFTNKRIKIISIHGIPNPRSCVFSPTYSYLASAPLIPLNQNHAKATSPICLQVHGDSSSTPALQSTTLTRIPFMVKSCPHVSFQLHWPLCLNALPRLSSAWPLNIEGLQDYVSLSILLIRDHIHSRASFPDTQ